MGDCPYTPNEELRKEDWRHRVSSCPSSALKQSRDDPTTTRMLVAGELTPCRPSVDFLQRTVDRREDRLDLLLGDDQQRREQQGVGSAAGARLTGDDSLARKMIGSLNRSLPT
jgi:hypothetical protein